jgi:hypothetical protein
LLLSHSKPLRKSAILNNFVWFHDMPPSDEGGGNRKVDGGRDNAKQKFTVPCPQTSVQGKALFAERLRREGCYVDFEIIF